MITNFEQFGVKVLNSKLEYPISVCILSQYIAYLFSNKLSPATIATNLSAISFKHKALQLPDPSDSFIIRKVMKGVQNSKGQLDTRLPITFQILKKLIDSLPYVIANHRERAMLKAMLLLAFAAFLRIGEIAIKSSNHKSRVIQVEDVKFNFAHSVLKSLSVSIVNYKHSDLHPKVIYIAREAKTTYCPVIAVYEYVQKTGIKSGPIFQFASGSPVSCSYFADKLKALLTFNGFDTKFYKGHSIRIGAASSAAARGVPLQVIQHMGRWKSDAVKNYIRMSNFSVS